mmetsp:Transcript_24503/g.80312  ORF Transcript_24503/g.80312 Transcript_24503/m.80312 type:complete len:112 (-) Transcript_24503:145-480(-)
MILVRADTFLLTIVLSIAVVTESNPIYLRKEQNAGSAVRQVPDQCIVAEKDPSRNRNHLRLRGGVVVDVSHHAFQHPSKSQPDAPIPLQESHKLFPGTKRPKLSRTIEDAC